ncbi:MAG: undecaprenyldiphospho-muramoylpentapeptide beta-N-acetylglucosaminyltransferase [Acidobacteriota bacterium]
MPDPRLIDLAPTKVLPFAASTTAASAAERRPVVVLAGGKTGGHIFPALAVAEELERRGWSTVFLGTSDGMERRLAEERGIRFVAVEAAPMLGSGVGQKIKALLRTLLSAAQAWHIVRRESATAVIGTGGFVSAPGVLGGRLAGLPVVLLEPNASAGLANRWLSRVAGFAALAHLGTANQLRCPSELTGVPVRDAFFAQSRRRRHDQEIDVLILGGSQGARELNRTLPELLKQAVGASKVRIRHQTGAAGIEQARTAYAGSWTAEGEDRFSFGASAVQLTTFIDDMPEALGGADLIVSRAGAVTLAEICAVGRASVLIPLPIAAGHQGDNARALVEAGAAFAVDEADLSEASVLDTLKDLLAAPEKLDAMGQAARRLSHENAAEVIADHVQTLAEEAA